MTRFRLPELGGEAIEPRLFVSTYHDTADHRLARRGITLRHRVENGKGLWQLKLPHGNARLELEEPGAPGEPPEALSALLAGHLRGVPLLPIARLRTHREGVRADGAEIVHDTVAVLDHQRVTRSFEELEVELLDGDEKTLRRLEKALRRAGAADGETRPKVFQALDLDFQPEPPESGDGTLGSGRAARPPPRAGGGAARPRSRDAARHRLRGAAPVPRRDPAPAGIPPRGPRPARPGDGRAAPRRAALAGRRARARPRPRRADRAPRRARSSTLGGDEAEGRKLVRTLDRSRRSARRRLLAALDSPRYFALLDALEQPFATVADEPSLAEIHAAEHRKLKKAVKALTTDSPDEELHAARIRVKRARYAAELEGDKPYVSAAKRLQDVLGEHQDAVVAIEKLRDLAGRMPDAAVAAGRLIEREQERARRTRGAWQAAWKRLAKTV